ncbi:MAG: putative membrane protein YdfK [Firmicutes bacterium ADurb.Bin456]|nr:MAG: putative membrane protein YdfK [Firmicutes bacterium ADurb.Bin456]
MILTGVLANAGAVLLGGIAGVSLRQGFPERLNKVLMQGLGLCVLYVGISGTLAGKQVLVTVLSIVLGAALGEWLDLDRWLNRLGDFLQSRFSTGPSRGSFAEGFINATLFACVGAMAIVGSLQSGLNGNHETLLTKALIDGVVMAVMASTLGIGVCLAAVPVFLYESFLTLSARAVAGYLTTPVINEISCVGSLLIVAIALNMLQLTRIKVANLIPAAIMPVFLFMLFP